MADTLPPVIVEIQLKQDQFTAAMKDVQNKLNNLTPTVEKSHGAFSKLGEGFQELAGMATKLFAVVEIFNFLKESTKVAAQNAESYKIMELQLTRVTGATKAQVMATDQQLEAMSEVSGVLIGNIRPGFEKLVLSTHNTTKALQLQKLAMDVSAATGKPLTTVSMALAKSYEGNNTMLNRLVPSAKNASDKFGYLAKTFHGAAQAAGDANPYGRLQVMMEKIKVSLGTALVPLISMFGRILLQLMPVVNMIANLFSKVMAAVEPLIEALVTALVPVFEALMKAIMPIIDKILPPLVKWFKDFLVPIITFLADILAKYVIPIVGKMVEWLAKLGAIIVDKVVGAFKWLMGVIDPFWKGVLKPMLDGLLSFLGIKADAKVTVSVDKSQVDKTADSLKNLHSTSASTSTGSSTGGSPSQTPAQKSADAIKTYQAAVKTLMAKHTSDMASALKDHTAKVAEIVSNGASQLTDIIKQSKDMLTSAFRDATKIDAGSMFMQAGANIDNMLAMLKNKLATNTKLAEDTGKLAGLGYSQEFIQQLVAQGPEVGDQLAQQLIAGGVDKAKEVQGLVNQVNQQSMHGVDQVADSIFAKAGLATEELKTQYATAQADLVKSLKTENDAYAASSDQLVRTYEISMAKLAIARDKAKKSSDLALGTAAGRADARLMDKDIARQNAIIARDQAPNININTSVTATTNATADAIAQATVNAIKFNAPVVATGNPNAR